MDGAIGLASGKSHENQISGHRRIPLPPPRSSGQDKWTRCDDGKALTQKLWLNTGQLKCEYIVQAVAPNYNCSFSPLFEAGPGSRPTTTCDNMDKLLRPAYSEAFNCAARAGCRDAAVPMLAGGAFEGERSIDFITETMVHGVLGSAEEY